MVRETRHLWVGNLPHTIREERILDHFKRYGKVQSVKILPKKEDESGTCATVAFIDIKSAAKAHNADNKIDERTLKTDYYEPPASSTASSAIFIHERDDTLVRPSTAPYAGGRSARYQHGLPEERNYDRTGHYYERIPERESYLRRSIGMGYHDDDNYQGRGKSRDRYSRNSSGGTYTEGAERNQSHFRTHNARQHFEQQRYPASDQYGDDRDGTSASSRLSRRPNAPTSSIVASVASPPHSRSESRQRRIKRRSPSRSPSGSRSNSRSRSRSRSSSGSRSSSSSSKLQSSSSDTSSRSRSPSKSRSPAASYGSQSNAKGSRLDRPASAIANPSSTASYLPSAVTSSAINCTPANSQGSIPSQGCMPASNENSCEKDEKRPLGICVRNLPVRSTDTSLKDGLFHEYKKHGKVTMVKVIGQGTERYAVVCFKKPEDVEKALEVSKDKLFFGCKIEVTAHEGLDAEDNEFRPLEAELDEYHPKATRTLFIGNLEKDITTVELRKHFDQFGEIIEIDIKKQGAATSYAFIQYSDIASVVKAMRKLDGENLGANRIKLGFGKSMPTNCVWLDGIVDGITEKFLARHFSRFGPVAYATVDREKGHALVFYDSVEFAQIAVSEMRGRILGGKKLQVDFASRECQTTFFDKLEMTGQMVPGDRPWERRERRGEFEIIRDDRDTRVGFENRVYPRYDSQSRTTRGNFRGIQRAGFNGRGRGQGFSARYEVYHDEFGERRHRNYDEEYSQGSGASFEDSYEQELREYGYSQRERREYATDDRGMIARSFSPVRRRDTNSISPPPKERHRDERSTSPHARSERTSTSSRGDKHEDHPRERYGSREESTEESTTFETKMERVKYGDSVECQGRKRNKLRNSISDQESHHSQSPPHSRHHSRSISPPSKERKSIKDRLHHRIKSPSSHSSSQMNSPCREVVADDVTDINADYRDCRHKCGEEKIEQRDVSDSSFSLTSTKCDPCADGSDKIQPKNEVDLFKRRSVESDCIDENLCVSDQLSQLERKRRLLASATSVALSKDINVITTPKLISDRSKLKTSTIIHSNLQKSVRANCISDAISVEDVKSDTESGELQEESGLEKPIQSESANSLKSLQKKQVQILHLLEQLREGVNSSDTEGSTDSEKPSHKKPRSASSCIELNMFGDNDISKAITKEECSAKLIKSGLKENSLFSRGKIKSEVIDSSNCIALSLDSLIFRKHLDPRKGFDQQSLSLTSVSRLQKSRRTSVEKDDSYVPNSQGTSEPFLCLPSTATSDGTWRKQCASLNEGIIVETDAGDTTPRIKGREENLSDDTSSSNKKKSFQSAPPPLLLESPKSFPLRTFPDSLTCHETKREISPLSLPLPKFAASLRSPKSSPNPLTSPKSSALSPRAGHSPSTFLSSKVLRIPEVLQEIKNEKKPRNQESKELVTVDDRLNGANMSPVHTTASSIESQQPSEVPIELMPSLPSIQSPKSSTAKSKENSSSDSECSPVSSPNRPSIEERIKALDEKFNAWSGSTRTVSNSLPEVVPSVVDYQKYSIKKRSRFNFLTSEFRTEPSEIVKSLLAKSTIFDQDSKRLEHINEKYEPKEIKLDLSPKLKPTFRTKAAAKEFSTPITPSLQTYNQTAHGKFPSLVTTGTLSPPLTPQTTVNNATIPSPVALSPASHYTHTSPQHFVPCSLTPSLIIASSSVKGTTESITQHKEIGEQAGLASKPLETIKIKTEPELPITSSMPVTLVPTKALTSVSSSSSVIPHTMLPNSLSSNIKKEQIAQKEHNVQISNKEQVENKDFCVKKEFPLLHVSNIPPRRDCTVAVIKDQTQYKDVNSIEHCRKETYIKESSDRKDLLHNVIHREGSNQWRDSVTKECTKGDISLGPNNLCTMEVSDSVVSGVVKKRVSSIDSNESDSGKSSKSLESSRDSQELTWRKQEKQEMRSMEPEHKKPKLSASHTKTIERERSPSPNLIVKKCEKKEKNSKNEKFKASNFKLNVFTSSEKEDNDLKNGKNEFKDKIKSEIFKPKEEKRSKVRETKELTSKADQKVKSREGRSSDRESKSGHSSNGKNRKEHSINRNDKQKSERKSCEKAKSESSKSPRSKQDFQCLIEEEPVYFSMYDKVKARSSQNQSLKDQAKDLETMRQKFNKLKQSRAKREEKSKSVDQESDKESDSASRRSSESDTQAKTSKSKQQRKRKLVIESSSEDDLVSQSLRTGLNRHENKDFSDIASDSECEFSSLPLRHTGGNQHSKNRGRKPDLIETDSSDSESHFPLRSHVTGKKKSKLKHTQEKGSKLKIRSEDECSEAEITSKQHTKDKEHKRKKIKKEKVQDIKSDHDTLESDTPKKFHEESKSKKKSQREDKHESDIASIVDETISSQNDAIKEKTQSGNQRERKTDTYESSHIDDEAKHKSFGKKKKKSKKASKNKDKRLLSDKNIEDSIKKIEEEMESKSSLPTLMSPKPTSPAEKPLSPPRLEAGILSDNDFKSDFSDFDFVSHRSQDIDLNVELWRHLETKTDCDSERCTKSVQKKETSLSPSKLHSDITQSEPDPESSLPSFLDKICDVGGTEENCDVHENGNKNSGLQRDENYCSPFSSFSKEKEPSIDDALYKISYEKNDDQNDFLKNEDRKNCGEDSTHTKDEKRKKKSKKQYKEKRRKIKEECSLVKETTDCCIPVKPSSTSLIFDQLHPDDDSRLSDDIRLDEEIAEEARRLEQELLAASEETSTFGDDGPIKREEKPLERRFEEEAAKETRRLEEELFSTARESWHMKEEKPFDDSEHHPVELCSSDKEQDVINTLTIKEENIFAGLEMHTVSAIESSQHENQSFLVGQPDSDQYKIEDKDDPSDMENQRETEDALAVTALLQEMNSGEISAPELTKETDYLNPLDSHPEETMNYLLPEDSQGSLHIANNNSPELHLNESQEAKLQPVGMLLSPSSNSEPPALEISNVDDTVSLKNESEVKPCETETLQFQPKTEHLDEIAPEDSSAIHSFSLPTEHCPEVSEQSKPPVIDIPSDPAPLEPIPNVTSPKNEVKKLRKKRRKDRVHKLAVKDEGNQQSNEETDYEPNSDQAENQLSHFEDITMDTADSKDEDDNPPVLQPVDSPRVLAPSPELKEIDNLDSVSQPAKENSDTVILEEELLTSTEELISEAKVPSPPATPTEQPCADERKGDEDNEKSLPDDAPIITEETQDVQSTDTEIISVQNISSPVQDTVECEKNCVEDKTSDIEPVVDQNETDIIAECKTDISEVEDQNDKKIGADDADSAGSATIESHISDVNTESEISNLNSNEDNFQTVENKMEVQDSKTVNDFEMEEKQKSDRPRRGRRPKTRKYSESTLSLPRYETSSVDLHLNPTPPKTPGKRGRPPSSERVRRSLRTDASDQVATLETKGERSGEIKQITSDYKSEITTYVEQDKNEDATTKVMNEETSETISETLSVDTTNVEADSALTHGEMQNPLCSELETKSSDRNAEQVKSEEPKRRRGRKKKGSADHQNYSVTSNEKTESKHEELEHKDFHRPKESRLWLSLTSEKEQKSSKENASAYDVFEFRDSEDEELTFERDLQSCVKERLLENTRSITLNYDQKHDAKATDITLEKEKKPEEPKVKNTTIEERESNNKEYVTEVNQHRKISITIRLHQKDGHDGTSAGTAEVVKTSEALNIEETKAESSKTEKCGLPKLETANESSYNGPGKSTRKSTRLMNQAAKSTVDEVIEDVVKGNFKPFNSPPLEVTPTRVTRRSRSNRRSEESVPVHPVENSEEMLEDKNKNEPVFFILDNTVKDVPDSKKVLQNQTVDTSPVAEVTNNSEPDRITDRIASLRSFRITRSTANKLETNKDNSLSNNSMQSGTIHETESLKRENLSSAASDEKKELSTFVSPPKDSVKENVTQNISENISYRPPLPVLKVELPRMVLPGAKEIFNKIEKNEDNEEDSDSRSSPAVLIDPVTGFLTPVNKNGEPTGDIQESSSLASVISTLETKDRTESSVTELADAPHATSSAACTVSDIKNINKTLPADDTGPCIKAEENDSQSKLKLSQDTFPVTQDNHQSAVPPPKILTTTPPTHGTQAICVTQPLNIPVTISAAPLYVSSASVVGSSESVLPLKSPSTHEKDSDYPKLYNAKSQTCAHVGVLTSTTIAPSPATLTTTTATSSGSVKAISSGSIPTQTVTQMGQPAVPQSQQVCGWTHSTTGAPPILTFDNHPPQNAPTSVMSRASRSNISLPSPNYQSSPRTLVTAVVTVAASGLTQANLSSTSPKTKCIPSTIAGLSSHATTLKSEASMTHTTTTVTQTIPQVETVTCMCSKTATTNSIVVSPLHSNAAVMKSEGPASSTPGSSQVSATWTNSKAAGGNRTTAPPELISHKNTVLNVPLSSNIPIAVKSETRTVQTSKVTHSHAPKNNPSYLQQAGFPVSAYEATVHSSPHGLASSSSNSGGVIAELLQNPQLLQQHKDFFAAAASGQFQERIQGQMVRPSTPVASGIPPEIAARLGSPTPPHTPTPPVTSASHSLQPPEIHPAHVAAGLHLRHPTQPPLIVPPHPPLGIHPSELNAYVHQQMIYAAAHPHYAAIHPELRAQQEAQARAAVAMGITPRFAYPPIPPAAVPPSSFRQPLDPRLPHPSATDIKSENKSVVESTKIIHEHRVPEDKTQPVKPVRIKQEIEKEMKVIHPDINRLEESEAPRPHSAHDKVSVASAVPPHGSSLRPQHIPYSSAIRQLSPHLTVSPHERITDSPVVANLYTQGQNRVPPVQLPGQIDDHKESVMLSQQAHHIKSENQERDIKPPIAHQTLPSTIPYHTLEPTVHPARQPLLGVPQVGSPAPGYVDNRSLSQSAHSPGSLTYKKDTGHPQTNTIISQMHTPGEKRTNQDISKKVVHTRTHGHQGPSSISPGPAGLGTAHSPLPWPPGIQPHNTHSVAQPPHSMIPPSEQSTRRGNLHVTPQMGSEVPVHAPPPAHAMSQPTSVPRTQPQTPPHASQVPPQGDSFLLQRYPVMWQGLLALKNDQAAVQMHFVSGNPRIARASLPPMAEGGTPPVRIAQRMRLEQTQLEGVARKMQMVDEHCILLALPCGRDHMDVLQQSNNLRNGFINYLQLKQAAGIVNAAAPGSQQPAYVIHIFPSCDFSDNNLARIAPDLLHSVSDIAHLLIIIATV